MFNFITAIKKATGFYKEPDPVEEKKADKQKQNWLENKIGKLSGIFDKIASSVSSEYQSIKEKSKDLYSTNYKLGMRFLEEGNLKEAIFRFKITKKFWPNNYDAYYQLAICLILNEEFAEAQKVIDELLTKNPDYQIDKNHIYREKIDYLLGKIDNTPQS
ncbi:MAG: Tetratricopeptide repeat [Rickettsiaceae bacterium]|jgi:tetratricopeptide (TPR) repeat protein|nr:Tetratricopeptide repeat [Rickettsiaceae bacterium]